MKYHNYQPNSGKITIKNYTLRFSVLIVVILLSGLFSGCGSSTSTVSEKSDPELSVSGYIMPINFHSSAIGSHNYYGWIIIDDVSSGSGVPITDANVTINGQIAAYSTTYGFYYLPSIAGTFDVGSTFTVTINHPRVTLTRTLIVPTSTVPAAFTFYPLFDNLTNKTVQNTTYTITPTSAWSNFGCIIAYLYGTGTNISEGYNYWATLSTGAQFTSSNLSFGTPAVLSQNISFAAWSEDKVDLEGFNSTTLNRLRVWAPNGTTIAHNF